VILRFPSQAAVFPPFEMQKQTILCRLEVLGQDAQQWDSEFAAKAALEYFCFMAMKAKIDTSDQPSKLAPPFIIELMWTAHILDTRSYSNLEHLLQPQGGKFHYDPIKDEDTDLEYLLASTKTLYAEFYNTSPPTAVWVKEGKINTFVYRFQTMII
jgi:hypothetical protein